MFSLFSKKKEKAQVDVLKVMQKGIDTQLRTFTNHLRQISGEYASLHEDNLKIIKLLEKLAKNEP